ncbi:hypothetical protein M758_4G088100 [Ceratodon purpureus]|nr:hypothetical protein M758_4G088100 [Ceratodon purpureus]
MDVDGFGSDVDLSGFDIHRLQLQAIEDRVQDPPLGIFGPRDLRWDLEYCPPRGEHKKSHVVQQCFVPTDRVQDFIEGMQCGREGAQCKFRANKENRKPNLSRDGHKTSMEFTRFRCEYGPKDFSGITKVPATRSKIKRDSKKKWENSIKRGCQAQFTVKRLLYLPHVSEICIIQEKHVNRDGLVVHGGMKNGDRSAFSAHLSPEIRSFVEDCLRRKDTPIQIMKKHIDLLKQYQAQGKDITRDLFLTTKDIRNISGKLAQETYMLHKNDAQSVRMWVQRNPEKVFYYTESNKEKPVPVPGELTGSNMPFTIGIQTEWQRKMMLEHGHRSGISVDATFGTNEKKFPLYTLMVFDEWHNGVPVAFVLTSKCAEVNLTPWMRALNERMVEEKPDWEPAAFIVDCAQGEINAINDVWPETKIFLCLWHVRRAWQKNSCYKIADHGRRATIMKELGLMMYDRNSRPGVEGQEWAKSRIEDLEKKYPQEMEFWAYMKEYWVDKAHMWVVGFRNLKYCGQDTNAAIEGYHGFAKSILRSERSRMTGRRVD